MSGTVDNITTAALQLPYEEKVMLANRLYESLDTSRFDDPVRNEWMLEIRRRVEEIESGRAELFEGEHVFAEARQMLAK